ncbi:hypothetical protein DICPUDRAFT_41400 [Dictyostelium purpureum]|uniref:Uncharacterized protein n=1 Tax=Dictyostelium purpureum TaxID=5786 RepID=F1A008_DICPU|nr:uncharacterized protein DICPUDRAFT_41400 [Dictyostelium purpureum]EGC30475.1 hypothetical protein DICPUDRAFT_41400 [Dictyostelium purpureum]|eukprot:XP_003293004.1 hypothetical protein DICPUDRAFT_41400 [Dictyostelium purpureum]
MDITVGCTYGLNKIYNIHKKQPVGLYGTLDSKSELNVMTYGWESENQEDYIFYGYNNGNLKYFNNKEKTLIGELNYEHSIQAIHPLKNDKLLVALNNGSIDVKTFSEPFTSLKPINLPTLNKKKPTTTKNNKNQPQPEPVNTQSFVLNVANNIGGFTMNPSKDKFAFGGKDVNLTIYDLETQSKTYTAKFKHDFLNIQEPVNIFDIKYMNDDKVIIGSGFKLKGYDLRSKNNRDSFLDVSFSKNPIQRIQYTSQKEFYFYASDAGGKLFTFDIRTGKHCGSFKDSVGSIRDVQIHPTLPLLATVGLDRFLRVYNLDSRKMLQKVFLKQRLSGILFSKEEPNESQEDEELWKNLEENNNIVQVKEESGKRAVKVKVTDNMDSDDEVDSDDNNGFDDDDSDEEMDSDEDGLDGSEEDVSEFNIKKENDDSDSDEDNKKSKGNNKKKINKKPVRKPAAPQKSKSSQVLKKKLSGLRKLKK